MSIRVLPSGVVSQIAAGEVIERPASAIKELIENALDAGSTQISVSVSSNRIVVTDNGAGMSPEDLSLSLSRHATSKLVGDDIQSVSTLGFRGEALHSIATVSDLSIISRRPNSDCAWIVSARSGDIGCVKPRAGSVGTKVDVYDLFAHQPARLKFQKSQRSEAAAIREVISSAAMAHPSVEFRFSIHGKEGRYPSRSSLTERVMDVYGRDFAECSIPVSYASHGIAISGVISLPSANKASGPGIKISVNGRPVTDRSILSAVKSAYASHVGPERHSHAYLALRVPEREVDINVHPRKAEVRFARSDVVSSATVEAVTHALSGCGISSPTSVTKLAMKFAESPLDIGQDRKRLPLGRFVGQVNGSWIVSETADGLVIIDQHAAHERVILEKLRDSFLNGDASSFTLSSPYSGRVSDADAAAVDDGLHHLRELGFSVITDVAEVRILAIPSQLSYCTPEDILSLLVRACRDGLASEVVREALWSQLANVACKAAVKAGDELSETEADSLLRAMEATPNAGVCNHGRPTLAFLKDADIRKLFAR